jgi:hypothetical protein
MHRTPALLKAQVAAAVITLGLCGCSNTIHRTVRYPYAVVQAHVLQKGGKVVQNEWWTGCELEIVEGSSDGGITLDHTWIRATQAGTDATKVEVESVKNVAFSYWQKDKERQRLREFLEDLK